MKMSCEALLSSLLWKRSWSGH